jgi:hypothetical protein
MVWQEMLLFLCCHDSIIVGNFNVFGVSGGPFNIFIGVMSSSYNVPVASTYM